MLFRSIKGNITVDAKQAARPEPDKLLPEVKNIIAVSSGKGGVGKSTVAANLAVALALQGHKVGLLDADIFGPSQPKMFNVEEARPYMVEVGGRELIEPAANYGVKLLSIGFFVNKEDAVLWRGAMASNALKQLIGDANWGDLDYFLIDLPPGTSDIHLTMVQTLAITGAIVVSTPQEVALADARKGISMFTGEKTLRVAMNVDRIGLMEKITVLHTGIVRAVRVLTIITVKAGMATTVRGAMVIVVHLMATIAKVGMEIIARLMATTVKVATTAAARLMEITARRMGMGEDNTIVRLVRIMMARQRLIPLVLPERECLRMV